MLIKRMGVSQEDIDSIEEEIMMKDQANGQRANNRRRANAGSSSYANRKSRISGPAANNYGGSKVIDGSSRPGIQSADYDDEIDDLHMRQGYNQHLADSGPIVADGVEQELDLQTIRDEDGRESQNQSRLEHRQDRVQGNSQI